MAEKKVTNLAEDVGTNAQPLLRQAFRETQGYDMREGSALYTLFVGRLGDLLQPVTGLIGRILGGLNINLSSEWTTFYDVLGAAHLATRDSGQRATGAVILGLSAPQLVEIDAGENFSTRDGVQFTVDRRYVFSAAHLSQESGLYYTPPIGIQAVNPGQLVIPAGAVVNTSLSLSTLVDVYNPNPISGGATEESGAAFVERLKQSISNRTFSSRAGVEYALRSQFTSLIHDVMVIGKNDPEMARDLVWSYTGEQNGLFGVVDYGRKRAQSTTEEQSIAYKGLHTAVTPTPVVDGDDVASIPSFSVEVSPVDYGDLAARDSVLFRHQSQVIMTEDWVRAATMVNLQPWQIAETNGSWQLAAAFAKIENERLWLGSGAAVRNQHVKQAVLQALSAQVNQRVTEELSSPARRGLRNEMDAVIANAETAEEFRSTEDFVKHVVQTAVGEDGINLSEVRPNVSPVVQQDLSQNDQIVIQGDFTIEDDDASNPRPLYITNYRIAEGNPRAHDGFGVAVMPSAAPGDTNVFITDNNALGDELFIAGDKMVDTLLTENFLAGVATTITIGQQYNYELIYGAADPDTLAVSLDVRIWAAGDSRPAESTISYGAYTPMNVRATDLAENPQTAADASAFGFGVMQTEGFLWSLGPVTVQQGGEVYAQALFQFDLTGLTEDQVEIFVDHVGQGANNGVTAAGSVVSVLEFSTPQAPTWETVETSAGSGMHTTRAVLEKATYVDGNGQLFLLVSSAYPHGPVNGIQASIAVDYVAVSSSFAGVHVGGKIDAYIQMVAADAQPETETTVDLFDVGNTMVIDESNGFQRPVTRVDSLEILDAQGDPTGTFLVENDDYRVVSLDASVEGSPVEERLLLFSDAAQVYDVRVTYRCVQNLDVMQAYVDGATAAPTQADVLVRHPRPKYISVSFTADYQGQDLIDAIRDYIYAATERVTAYDIIGLARDYGVASTDIANFSLTAEMYDANGNLVTESATNELTRTRTQVFIPETITITP